MNDIAQIQTLSQNREMTVADMKSHVSTIEQMTNAVMKENMHYGKIPGCGDKPTLLLPGAQKLALAFQLSVRPIVEVIDLEDGHREYRVEVELISRANGIVVGTGVGNCNTMESKYRFRSQVTDREVPKEYWNGRDPELLGGKQYSPKKVGNQWLIAERIEHDNPADYYNTCVKMAKKRALVDATLTATGASDHFTQDIEDNPSLYGGTDTPTTTGNAAGTGQKQPQKAETSAGSDDVIWFGKHKGKKFSEVAAQYLDWCVNNAQSEGIQAAAKKELERREHDQTAPVASGKGAKSTHNTPASEDQIREIHAALTKANFEMLEVLDMFDLKSTDQIRDIDVKHILKWIKDPSKKPETLPAF